MPVKVGDCSNNVDRISSVSLVRGFDFVYNLHKPGGERASAGAVINFSGFQTLSEAGADTARRLSAIEKKIDAALNVGVAVVTSANNHREVYDGNNRANARDLIPSRHSYGNYEHLKIVVRNRGGDSVMYEQNPKARVITVGGSDEADRRMALSGLGSMMGNAVDIFAPATNIESAGAGSTTAVRTTLTSGTSFASPLVAGVVALYYESRGPVSRNDQLVADAWKVLRGLATKRSLMENGTSHRAYPFYWQDTRNRMLYWPYNSVRSIAPRSGPASGGLALTIRGTNFQSGASVLFRYCPLTGACQTFPAAVTSLSQTTIVATQPGGLTAATLYDVIVRNPGSNTNLTDGILHEGFFANFTDVPASLPEHDSIEMLYRTGVSLGVGGGNFSPNELVTRASLPIFLLRAKHPKKHPEAYAPPPVQPGTTPYVDVPVGSVSDKWIYQARLENIVYPCITSSNHYCPADPVTRSELARFLLMAEHSHFMYSGTSGDVYSTLATQDPVPSCDRYFTDVPTSDSNYHWIQYLCAEGAIPGSDSLYRPSQTITRKELAAFLVKVFRLDLND